MHGIPDAQLLANRYSSGDLHLVEVDSPQLLELVTDDHGELSAEGLWVRHLVDRVRVANCTPSAWRPAPPIAAAIRLVTQAVESVPTFLWVLAAFASYRAHSTTIIPIAFLLAVLPISTHVLRGEFERISREPYLDAAKLSGVSLLRLLAANFITCPTRRLCLCRWGYSCLESPSAFAGLLGC